MSVENLKAATDAFVQGDVLESLARVIRLLDAKDAEIERLKAQLAASEEKRKVLGAECQAWRKAWQDVPCSKPECSICLSTKATDAVSALEGT